MATRISKLAELHPDAELSDDVEIGPFCFVGSSVRIGTGTKLENSVTIKGPATIGCGNHLHSGAVIGGDPQDTSYRGSETRVVIGDHNIIREGVTVNRGSEKEHGLTAIGSHCYLMAYSHVAHDCRLGDHVTIANSSLLGGHVHVQDYATLSGAVAVHHFTTIGRYSFVGGMSRVLHDIPPYMLAEGSPCRPRCVNSVALKRHSFSQDVIQALSDAHRLLYRGRVGLDHARDLLRSNNKLLPQVTEFLGFVQNQQEGRRGRARELRRAA